MLGFSIHTWLIANLCASLFMTGVIWFVQIVHYPLFANVAPERFVEYERLHANRTGYVVGPVMCFELAVTAVLAYVAFNALTVTSSVLVIIIWISTFAVQVPCHNRLAHGYNPQVQRRLVLTNWIRTFCWTARSVLLLVLLVRS